MVAVFSFFDRTEDGIILTEITEIELWRDDAGLGSDWFCDVIILLDLQSGRECQFYCYHEIQKENAADSNQDEEILFIFLLEKYCIYFN